MIIRHYFECSVLITSMMFSIYLSSLISTFLLICCLFIPLEVIRKVLPIMCIMWLAALLQALYLLNWTVVVLSISTTNYLNAKNNDYSSFDWSSVKSSPDLEWHKCYTTPIVQDSTQHVFSAPPTLNSRDISCARLSLPLNYHNTSNIHKISLPILKISSRPSPTHRGTITLALGGAGNSRINDLIGMASQSDFLHWIDPNFEYDFLTFDNRGLGYSQPSAKCFDNLLDGEIWEQRMDDLGAMMSTQDSDAEIEVRLIAAKSKGSLCARKSTEDSDIRRHMTTAYAARDMLEILKRLPDHEQNKEQKVTKLQFLGLSYGTMVGQTFASMYPEHVSRMILDGAAEPKDWTGKWQMQHLFDTDAVWESFYKDCFEAKQSCPLWKRSDVESTNIKTRVDNFLIKLRHQPAYTLSNGNTRLITYRDLRIAIYWTTMAPAYAFTVMAASLDGLMRGYTNITLDFPFGGLPSSSDCVETENKVASSNADAGTALNCGDAEDITNITISDFKHYLSELENQSAVAAFFQGERKIRCVGWPLRPTWRFTGPFGSKSEHGRSSLETPILFMGNKLDPMTSINNSKNLIKDWPGSVVLEQDARGHTVLGNTIPCDCVLKHLRRYLREGNLPEPGIVCGKDGNMFDQASFMKGGLKRDGTHIRVGS